MRKNDDSTSDQVLHTHHIFNAHRELLEDGVRNRAFYAAIQKRVTDESVVLDIGSGTGIWAITAALMGAKKVVAVERDPMLIRLIKNLSRENRVQDKIEIIEGDSRDIRLPREFNLFISETIGNSAFDEEIVSILIDARKRFLKRGAGVIPSALSLIAAPAYLKGGGRKLPSGVSISCNYFNSLSMNLPLLLRDRSRLKLVAEERELLRVDLRTVKKPPVLSNLTARWKINKVADMNCFVTWAQATLTEGVELSTLNTTSWSPLVYMIRPFREAKGELEFTLEASAKSNFWSASLINGRTQERQSYSPVLAFASLKSP
jgi:protein arginine N-methyltransferase 1